MGVHDLPALNAALNATAGGLLVIGHRFIRRGEILRHRACILTAFVVSNAFLVSYVVYHAEVGSVRFTHGGWPRVVAWAGAVMSASGFSWCYLIILTYVSRQLEWLDDGHVRPVAPEQLCQLARLRRAHDDGVRAGTLDEVVDGPAGDQLAATDHHEMVGHEGHLAHQVAGDEDRPTAGREALEQLKPSFERG